MTRIFFLSVVVPGIGLLSTLLALSQYKNWNRHSRILFYYLLLAFIFNVIARLTKSINNLPYLHLYTVLEFSVLCMFFGSYSKEKKNYVIAVLAFLGLAVWYGFFYENIFVFNKIPRFTGSLIITLFCINFLLKNMAITRLSNSRFHFISVSALLMYYSTCSILFGLSDLLMKVPKNIASYIWMGHATLNMVMYMLLAYAFFILKKDEQ